MIFPKNKIDNEMEPDEDLFEDQVYLEEEEDEERKRCVGPTGITSLPNFVHNNLLNKTKTAAFQSAKSKKGGRNLSFENKHIHPSFNTLYNIKLNKLLKLSKFEYADAAEILLEQHSTIFKLLKLPGSQYGTLTVHATGKSARSAITWKQQSAGILTLVAAAEATTNNSNVRAEAELIKCK
ncbi:hypothetical protein EVAR_69848_1 [Eumeta japonica]|uniref:Uncharacterized protein n=1 Tax=Eumeta variegata TaxID=151549 RepID=A0A4C2AEQ9_EUMVA|nr:hypothetical protein EVAR_69848_1 [Eumeta japonica]